MKKIIDKIWDAKKHLIMHLYRTPYPYYFGTLFLFLCQILSFLQQFQHMLNWSIVRSRYFITVRPDFSDVHFKTGPVLLKRRRKKSVKIVKLICLMPHLQQISCYNRDNDPLAICCCDISPLWRCLACFGPRPKAKGQNTPNNNTKGEISQQHMASGSLPRL